MPSLIQIREPFLSIAKNAKLVNYMNTEIEIPFSKDSAEAIFDSLLEAEFHRHTIGEIFIGFESTRIPIRRLDMSTRTKNALLRNKIQNIDELRSLTLPEIADFRNFGHNSLRELFLVFLQNLKPLGIDENFLPDADPIEMNPKTDSTILGNFPLEIIEFIYELSQDLSAKDLHVINGRSDISRKLTHGDIASEWGLSRQRIHQIEDRLRARFQKDSRLIRCAEMVCPQNTYQSVSEVIEIYPWLNMGVSIHPIGVSVINILIFSNLIGISEGWILYNCQTPFAIAISHFRSTVQDNNLELGWIGNFSLAVQEYLTNQSIMRSKDEFSVFPDESERNGALDSQDRSEVWLEKYLKEKFPGK